jgi:tetratricopeptide (TPR) repeat protein
VADIKSAADDDLPRLPDSLIDAVNRRFDTLSSAARDLLRCASIFGPRFSVAELSATLRTPAFEMLDVVHELIGTGVVVADVDRLAFGHCVTRDAIYESIPPSARQALHLEAAHALARTGAPIERVAEHLLSAQVLDSESLAWITAAADRLSLRAPELAVGLFHQALELANPADPQAGRLQVALSTALLATRRFSGAKTVARQAIAKSATSADQGSLRWILVQALMNEGEVASALLEARHALNSGTLSAVDSARFHGIVAQCLHVVSHDGPAAAKAAARQAAEVGLASGDPCAAAYGLQAIAGAERWDGRFVDALQLAGEAAAHLERAGSIFDMQLGPNLIRANCLLELDRTSEAAQAYAEDLKLAEAGVGTFLLAFHHLSVARMHFLQGEWDDALTEIAAARQTPDHLRLGPHLDGLAILIDVHRGDSNAAARHKRTRHEPLRSGPARHTFDDRSWGRSMAALADGDDSGAHAVLESAWSECAEGRREFCGH